MKKSTMSAARLEREIKKLKTALEKAEAEKKKYAESHETLNVLLNQIPLIFCITDKKLIIKAFEGSGLKKAGFKPGQLAGQSLFEIFSKKDKSQAPLIFFRKALKGEPASYDVKWKDRYFHSSIFPYYDGQKKIIGTLGLSVDVTEKEKQQKRMILGSLVNHLPGMAYRCCYDTNWTMLFISLGCYELTGYKPEELLENKKRSFASIVFPEDKMEGRDAIKNSLKKKYPFEIQYRIVTKKGAVKWVWEKGEGIYSEDGKLRYLEGFITDITKQKVYEKELAQSRENYKNLVEYLPDGIFIHDKKGRVIFANESALNIIGAKSLDTVNDKTIFHYMLPEHHDEVRKRRRQLETGEHLDFMTTKLRREDGKIIEAESKPIKCSYRGEECVLVVYHDISYQRQLERDILKAQLTEQINIELQGEIADRKKAEEKMHASLKEKEALLKEVHHRVKNNLQVISSILNLQSSYITDQSTLNLLKESQNRIKSMAFVHENLYQTKDFSSINFSEYIDNITKNLVRSYTHINNVINLKLNNKPISMSMDTAIPCGLIINELVSNSLKYAFNGKINGEISIIIKGEGDFYSMVIADNGTGLPDNIDFKRTDSLGLQLVATLVEQIRGKMSLDNSRGAKFTIVFPKK